MISEFKDAMKLYVNEMVPAHAKNFAIFWKVLMLFCLCGRAGN